MADPIWLDTWDELIAGGESGPLEEFWLARLEAGVSDPEEFLEALRRLRKSNKKTVAATLLELAEAQTSTDGDCRARSAFLRELLRLGIGDEAEHKAALEQCVRSLWSDRPSLAVLLQHFNLRNARKPLEAHEQLETWLEFDVGGVFLMAGRGPARVVEASPQLGMLRVDLETAKRVPVPIDAARKYLNPLAETHFLRRRFEEPKRVAEEVSSDPPAALQAILESFAGPMTVSDLKAALAGVLPESAWTSWWNRARKHPRLIASGSGTKVSYRLAAGEGADDELRAAFAAAPLTERLDIARRAGTRSRGLADWMAGELLLAALGDEPAALRWEAVAMSARLGAPSAEVAAAQAAILESAGAIPLLGELADAGHREAVLDLVRGGDPAWTALHSAWLERETSPRLLSRIATALAGAGRADAVRSFLDEVFLHPQRYPAAFVWACETDDVPEILDERRGAPLLLRLVELAERREFVPFRVRLKNVLSARGVAGAIVQDRLSPEQAARLLVILERPGELGEERSWLRRTLLVRFPELRQAPSIDATVPVLAGTVTRLQDELRDLLERQIPETLKAIQIAKEHGDLRENFEYHAARARQEFLSARAAKLQGDLVRVQVIDPERIDISRVRVGSRVSLVREGESRSLTILGPYEANPEEGVLSHASEAAQALLGRKAGEKVRFDGQSWRIEAIARYSR